MELARHDNIDTSHSAAASIEDKLTALQSEVFEAFQIMGSMTDKQLNAEFAHRDYAESTVRKRRSELTEMGLLKDSGERVGRHAVWEIA